MDQLRWGILGPGRIAPRLVRAIGASDRSDLVAVASRDPERAAAFAARHSIPRAWGAYDALLADPGVDVVYIALPNHLHAPWAVRALQAGKHVLCEKPLALSVDAVDAVAVAADRAGRIAVEAFMYLHHPQTIAAVDLARSGALGPLVLVNASFSFLLAHPDDPRLEPAMGGGSLWDVGCYPVSLARRIAGEEPTIVQALARFDERGVDRTFSGGLSFPGGLLARFDSGFAAPDRQRVEIVGRDASLVLTAPFLVAPDGPEPSIMLVRGGIETAIAVASADQYRAEVDDLCAAILDGTPPRVDLAFSRGTIAALVALDRAARAAVPDATGPGSGDAR
jgi:D-xylose 1-dehydrogenase (NADP+, D-xylono-1,5-lactone-forming)